MWWSPVPSLVSPIYMPGRLRTASRPFSTLMLLAPYSFAPFGSSILSVICCFSFPVRLLDAHRHDHVPVIAAIGEGDQHAAVRVAESAVDGFTPDVGQHVEEVSDVESDIEGLARILDLELLLRFFLLIVSARNSQTVPGEHPPHAAEFLVGEYRGALERLQQQRAAQDDVLLVVRRNDTRVIRKFPVDDLGRQVDRPEPEPHLVRVEVDVD